jgi:hypothetical protein
MSSNLNRLTCKDELAHWQGTELIPRRSSAPSPGYRELPNARAIPDVLRAPIGRRIHSPMFLNGPMSDNRFLMARCQERPAFLRFESNC